MSEDVIRQLAETISARRNAASDKSYTRKLLDGGALKCAKKFGEEAAELVIAGVAEDDAALKGEAADVIYHLLVLLEVRDLPLDDVFAELKGRMAMSGLEEKAQRKDKS